MPLLAITRLHDWLVIPYPSQWNKKNNIIIIIIFAVHCAVDRLAHSRCPVKAYGVTNWEDTVNERSSNIRDGMTIHKWSMPV